MVLIVWNESFDIGINEINNQHLKLIDMINRLHELMKLGKAKDSISSILTELVEYTKVHFKFEEDYFVKFNYVHILEHKKEHQSFVDKISDFKKDFDAGKIGLSIEIMNFLKDWLLNHIQISDMKYTKLFKDNGLK